MEVRIVPMTSEQLDDIVELEKICFPDPWSRQMFAEELKNDLSAFLAALDTQGHVVAYAGIQVVLDEGTITNIAVHPGFRRQGIAKKLLQIFLNFAHANQLAFLTLEVRASNTGAITLYQNLGFELAGQRRNYYEYPREDAMIMTLPINK